MQLVLDPSIWGCLGLPPFPVSLPKPPIVSFPYCGIKHPRLLVVLVLLLDGGKVTDPGGHQGIARSQARWTSDKGKNALDSDSIG